jgi:hypothetical protein
LQDSFILERRLRMGYIANGNLGRLILEARVRIELTIEVLQTSALPLGYRAV